MYSRADISRTVALVVARSLTAVSTGAMALAMPSLLSSIGHLQKTLDRPIGNEILGSFDSAARAIRLPMQIEVRKVD